jgi:hypothetical protein
MLSLSTHLAGITDDPLTDVYLNPARLSRFNRTQVYGTMLPRKVVRIPFPYSRNSNLQFGPLEDDRENFYYSPLVFSLITSIDDGILFSAGLQGRVTGSDFSQTAPSYNLAEWGNHRTLDRRLYANEQVDNDTHLLLDVAAAGGGEESTGLRLTVSYNNYRDSYLNSRSETTIDLSNLTDTAIDEYFSFDFQKYEKVDVALSMGIYKTDARLSDIAFGGAICKRQYSVSVGDIVIEDTDADRNGERIGGGSPYLKILQNRYNSHRDYLGLRLFGRAHWDVENNIHAVHEVSLHRSWGDGRAEFVSEQSHYSAAHDIDDRRGAFAYDGTLSDAVITTAAGYNKEIHNGFYVMIGVKGIYSKTWFEEDGEGNASVFLDQSNGAYDSLYYSSPYSQEHDLDEAAYSFVIPVACEWEVHEFVKLRFGMEITAYNSNGEAKFMKSVAAIDLPPSFEEKGSAINKFVEYDTQARFNSGIEINIHDKFILDLLGFGSHSSSVRLADYGYVSARYLF